MTVKTISVFSSGKKLIIQVYNAFLRKFLSLVLPYVTAFAQESSHINWLFKM